MKEVDDIYKLKWNKSNLMYHKYKLINRVHVTEIEKSLKLDCQKVFGG